MSQIAAVTQQNFEQQVLAAERPVLVDFYADWCGPCRAQAPVLKALAEDFAGRVDVVKVDVDANPELARSQNVRSIPTLVLFNQGGAVETRVGLNPQSELAALLDSTAAG